MAVYKVPQDVEADDKLIGPFSFRQFIYLIIVAISIAIGWGLSQIFVGLAILPLPIIVFFGALALPLKKDQPMEVYMAALVSFYLKPRRRLWDPDGIQSLVEVVAPKTVEIQRTKDLSQNEAERRLEYLAQIADTQGWAVRGVAAAPVQNTSMNDDLYFEAQQAPDILDENTGVGRALDDRLSQADAQRKQEMVARLQQSVRNPQIPTAAPMPAPQPQIISSPQYPAVTTPTQQPYTPQPQVPTQPEPKLTFNPYPNIHQSVIQPLSDTPATPPTQAAQPTPTTTSVNEVSPDIISLANNHDLSIETIAHEAQRIQKKEAELKDDEVVISLR
jgi:hypothetical protein